MDKEFTWNLGRGSVRAPLTMEEQLLGQENAAARAALAGALGASNAGHGNAYGETIGRLQDDNFVSKLESFNEQQQAQMAAQAKRAAALKRFQELEAERNEYLAKQKAFIENPNTQMAIGMALGGQPSALMSLIMERGKGGNVSQYQEKMDELESSITNAMFGLRSLTADDRQKLEQALIPIYRSKFEELISKGGKSRMVGTDWDSGWGQVFTEQSSALDDKRTKQKAAEEAAIAEFRGKFTEGSFGKDQSITKTASNGKTVTVTLTPNGVRYSCGSTKSVK